MFFFFSLNPPPHKKKKNKKNNNNKKTKTKQQHQQKTKQYETFLGNQLGRWPSIYGWLIGFTILLCELSTSSCHVVIPGSNVMSIFLPVKTCVMQFVYLFLALQIEDTCNMHHFVKEHVVFCRFDYN